MTGSLFAVLFSNFFPEINYSLFAIAGMAAVTSSVIGGPISTILIIFELTSDYQVALGAGISVCFANLISSKIYGHSAFDQILLNRNIDVHQGRDRLYLGSLKISEILNKNFIRLVPEHTVQQMIDILAASDNSEGYMITPSGKLTGKVSLSLLLKQKKKDEKLNYKLFSKYLFLKEENNVLEAIDKVRNFVGESIPVINKSKEITGVISESDLFSALLTAEKERNEEELG